MNRRHRALSDYWFAARFVLDHGRVIWLGRKLHDRCLCHASALPCERAADRSELGQHGGCPLQVLWTDPGGSRGLGVGPFGSEADHGYEFNFHRNRHLAGGTGFQAFGSVSSSCFSRSSPSGFFPRRLPLSPRLLQPPPAISRWPLQFLSGYLIGGGVVPTFIGIMGDTGSFAIGFMVTGTLILLGGILALLLRLPANNGETR